MIRDQQFIIQMEPVAKGRHRMTKTGRSYTPAKTVKAEAAIKAAGLEQGAWAYEPGEPLWVSMSFHFSLPKSWSKAKKVEMAGAPKVSKPDLDNLEKLVKDALNGVVWPDDSQVAERGNGGKFYVVTEGTAPYISVRVESMRED